MSIFCNYNIPTFPMTFGALTMGAGGCSVSMGSMYSCNPLFDFGTYTGNPFMSTLGMFSYNQPIFNFDNSNVSNNNSNTNSGWTMPWNGLFNNFTFSMPKFDFSNVNFNFSNFSTSSNSRSSSGDTFTRNYSGTKPQQLVQRAQSYVGNVNSDAEGNRLFSGGKSQDWCADFVTKVTRDTYGSNLPSSFGSSGVSNLRSWAQSNNCYMQTENKSTSEKKEFIANNVKPGDIMIEKRNGKSHTGIVTKVYSDGSFDTVEGNSSNKVAKRHYTADSSTLSGFINLDKYSA